MSRGTRSCLLASGVAVLLAGGAAHAPASASASGKLAVTVSTPEGVPANVLLRGGVTRVIAKPASGRRRKSTLSLPARRYRVKARPVAFDGRFYAGKATARKVRVRNGKTTRVRVRYRRVPSATALRPTAIDTTSLSLAWVAPKRAKFALRRAPGPDAPTSRKKGTAVRTRGATAVDRNLTAGTQYSYALFTKVRRKKWTGPLTLGAGTIPPAGSTEAAYVADPATLLPKADDVRSATPTGSAVRVQLRGRTGVPVIGAVVVLPASSTLPGGFLGRVTAVATDGTATLTAAGLSDAFDYYSLDIPEFTSEPAPLEPAGAEGNRSLHRAGSRTLSSALASCLGASGSDSITMSPSVGLGGHFKAQIDTHKIFGKQIPSGASLDMSFKVTATAATAARVSGSLKCSAPFKPLMRTLTATPVPISFYLSPVAEVSVNGATEASNVGVTATAGVQFAGSIGLTDASFSGGPVFSASALEPQGQSEGSIAATLGGEVIIGPGAGTTGAGVIAGVGGRINPVDASVGAVFPKGDSRGSCLKTDAAFTRELNLSAKAWVGSWDYTKSFTYDWLQGRTAYFEAPWHYPYDCEKQPKKPSDPGDSVLGENVEMVDDSTTGSPDQWGRVDGFVPGSETWVLSTGNIGDAVGPPDSFASSDMGMPGDADLTALAGHETYDAAGYQVRLIPKASNLHVSYVFASEEYPEYVGSEFNDVMQVWVDGQPCAYVPGTSQPVSVNTINAETNSSYFVDNASGAEGYSTAMDGLTVPLTCNATVTPGQEVTVKIAVADTSDGILDSAVALVDKGIWAD